MTTVTESIDQVFANEREPIINAIRRSMSHSPYYRKVLSDTAPRSYKEFVRIPITSAEVFRKDTSQFLSVPTTMLRRIHQSSGTTGNRKTIFYTSGDVKSTTLNLAESFRIFGVEKGDIVVPVLIYGPNGGGVDTVQGLEELGAIAAPVSAFMLPSALSVLRSYERTTLVTIASIALRLGAYYDADTVKRVIIGSEILTDALRHKLQDLWRTEDVRQGYGAEELGGLVAAECHIRDGMHVLTKHYFVEVVDPKSGEPVHEGERGEVAVTTLQREALPLIRYRIGDSAEYLSNDCSCGLKTPRIKVLGRADNTIIVGGILIPPDVYAEVIYSYSHLISGYSIILSRNSEQIDKLLLRVWVKEGERVDSQELKKHFLLGLKKRVPDMALAIGEQMLDVDCEQIDLSKSQMKSQTVVDLRR